MHRFERIELLEALKYYHEQLLQYAADERSGTRATGLASLLTFIENLLIADDFDELLDDNEDLVDMFDKLNAYRLSGKFDMHESKLLELQKEVEKSRDEVDKSSASSELGGIGNLQALPGTEAINASAASHDNTSSSAFVATTVDVTAQTQTLAATATTTREPLVFTCEDIERAFTRACLERPGENLPMPAIFEDSFQGIEVVLQYIAALRNGWPRNHFLQYFHVPTLRGLWEMTRKNSKLAHLLEADMAQIEADVRRDQLLGILPPAPTKKKKRSATGGCTPYRGLDHNGFEIDDSDDSESSAKHTKQSTSGNKR